ncbi:hypothetical protein JCM9140_2938 [Halalkalibacter wakoensis JCM 9140]|uniref:Uncharacterized protein n=1 Tax=Halalkalibacter wakoensis JCM 9140 TaxID=1236970 RepID=W4Q628_9BACI|nr:DUF5327 family protein [Halalkalibacter wakoensis]GAE26834.1 hypothetical protein JCM9140_2938 [Halalkalibacter wakoensis JCM 9140]
MNIPAKQICDQIDSQTEKLRKAIASGDATAVRECAAVIEAYSQLLKGTGTGQVKAQPVPQPQPMQHHYTQEPQQTLAKPLIQSGGEISEKDRNILDF